MYFNSRGLKSKIDVLKYELCCLNKLPDIIVITETWLDNTIILSNYPFNLNSTFRKDRNRLGGGVMILVSNSYNVQSVETNINIETVWCELVINKEKFVIGVIYRPPSSDMVYFNTMLDLINLMCDTFKTNNVILFGDFNLPSINWIDFVPLHSNVLSVQFLNCVLSNSLN